MSRRIDRINRLLRVRNREAEASLTELAVARESERVLSERANSQESSFLSTVRERPTTLSAAELRLNANIDQITRDVIASSRSAQRLAVETARDTKAVSDAANTRVKGLERLSDRLSSAHAAGLEKDLQHQILESAVAATVLGINCKPGGSH